MTICQSCAMPLIQPEDRGTNADGGLNEEYCHYCWNEGKFSTDETMEQMIESCVPHVIGGKPYPDAETAHTAMRELFPRLKRWRV